MIYLDNASTTKPSDEAKRAFLDACENFGNPSSLHNLGLAAEKIINGAKKSICNVFGGDVKSLYFTSGGTEANNMAIFGVADFLKRRGKHIITTEIEHPSVTEVFNRLESEGFEADYIKVDNNGRINLEDFESKLREDTILVSCMSVNNETGVIQPIDALKNIMRKKSPLALFHVDAVQGFCKVPIKQKQWGIDFISISGHKIGAVKGVGALYTNGVKIRPYIVGGGQQMNMRSGTENVPGIASFGAAAESYTLGKTKIVRDRLRDKIRENIEGVSFNGDNEYNCGYILNVSFDGIRSEILLHALERHGIYVSTGSACSSNKPMPSHVLSAMGVKNIDGAVRFSLSGGITEEDVDFCVEKLAEEVGQIRKYVRK